MGGRLICLIIILSLLFPVGCAKEEPTYQNRTMTEWIADVHSRDLQVRLKAIATLSRIGIDARDGVPALLSSPEEATK